MSNYINGCGLTGISIPELLVASHIEPWSKDEKNRLNPSNGICLSATYDKAFDKGLITINSSFKVLFSSQLKKYLKEDFYKSEFERFENLRMNLPIKFLPNEEFLQFHQETIFLG